MRMLIRDMVNTKNTKVKVTYLNELNIKLMAKAFYDLLKNKDK